ncbi:SANT/Myb_domain [Hexamita inflata]|uniref:SANT/Myb domain n=1 Tax=Hexamita inflata TaxID=28002 RepID=A0AA86NWN6_9EUKA|nr:SANT/Myb domain [Hexamita inflata]
MQAKYKPWSAQQKAQLLGMVQAGRASGQIDWQAVAKQFPDRTLNQLKSMATSLRPKTPQNFGLLLQMSVDEVSLSAQ